MTLAKQKKVEPAGIEVASALNKVVPFPTVIDGEVILTTESS